MLHHSINDVRILARAYLEASPWLSARELSLEITSSAGRMNKSGGAIYSDKLITRLLAGKSCYAENLELASNWFRDNWPPEVSWPEEVAWPEVQPPRFSATKAAAE